MNIKVRKTKNLDRRIVTRGKLVLIKCPDDKGISTFPKEDAWYKPIIISETEEIEIGDNYYLDEKSSSHISKIFINNESNFKEELSKCNIYGNDKVYKILALPEHFSPEILKMIVNGDLKDGQDLWIECEEPRVIARFNPTFEGEYFVKLTDNHINIFPIQQNPQLEKALDIYIKEKHTQEECIGFIDGFEKGTISKEQFKPLFDQMMSFIDNKIAKNNFNQYFKEL